MKEDTTISQSGLIALALVRDTIETQAIRIGELEAENKELSSTEDNMHTVAEDYYDKELVAVKAENRRMMTVIHQANDEMKEMRKVNKSMHDRLTAHAQDRLNGPSEPSILEAALSAAEQPLSIHGWLTNRLPPLDLAQKMKQGQMDRMENVCRLANAAIRHCRRGNNVIAEQLLKPLAGGQHDTYQDEDIGIEVRYGRENPEGWEDGQT